MQKATKVIFMSTAIPIVCLLLLASLRSVAQDRQPLNEEYQAQAMGQGTQMGQTFNVTILIQEYSTAEERQVLVDAFDQGRLAGPVQRVKQNEGEGAYRSHRHVGVRHQLCSKANNRRRFQTPRAHQSPDHVRRGLDG
jgi:hypothetical protein